MTNYDALRLDRQLCFPLYACSREVVKSYKPYLDAIGLTYTQYVTMMVLWEDEKATVKELGARLHLDSGTLTPLLKRLEADGLVTRTRSTRDERNLIVELTGAGKALRDQAIDIPGKVGSCIGLSSEEAQTLYQLLYRVLDPSGAPDACAATASET